MDFIKYKVYSLIKFYINDCSIGTFLIFLGILIGYSLNNIIALIFNK